MLTARGEEADRVRGLATGADDYIVKPFSVPELLARVAALLRRTDPAKVTTRLSAGDLELDREAHRVRRGGAELHLGPTEYRLLEFLMLKPGRVFSREQLLDGVWGRDTQIDERTVDVHIGRLQKALGRHGSRNPIRTVRASGYAFDETVTTCGGRAAPSPFAAELLPWRSPWRPSLAAPSKQPLGLSPSKSSWTS
jgi:two-component system phosphate regulon response regulator PhoB